MQIGEPRHHLELIPRQRVGAAADLDQLAHVVQLDPGRGDGGSEFGVYRQVPGQGHGVLEVAHASHSARVFTGMPTSKASCLSIFAPRLFSQPGSMATASLSMSMRMSARMWSDQGEDPGRPFWKGFKARCPRSSSDKDATKNAG